MGLDDETRRGPAQAPAPAPAELQPGMRAGDYVVERFIARGGCGSVYAARHRTSPRPAAIKVLHASLIGSPTMVERFAREVEVVKRLRHPCIVDIYDIGELPGGGPFYAMEFLEGVTLAQLLETEGCLTAEDALDLLEPVCFALAAAHRAGVVHRDLKAGNVFVSFEGDRRRVKLLDFGVAKLLDDETLGAGLTSVGRQVGTLSTMAPEQILCAPIDGRVDVYALGVLLYKLLTGIAPFRSNSVNDLIRKHLEAPPPRPSHRVPTPPGLDEVVLCCMAKRPERRYPTVEAFLAALRDVVLSGDRVAPSRSSGPLVPAVAVQVHLDVGDELDDLDDALADDLSRVLDRSEQRLVAAGFVVALTAGMTLVAVRNLHDETDTLAARVAALELASALRDELDRRSLADDRIDITIGVHADEATPRHAARRATAARTIATMSSWAPPVGARGLWARPEVLEGITGFESRVEPGGFVAIVGRASQRG